MSRRRVVVTGVGVVSAAGVGMDALWSAMVEGKSPLGEITRLDASGFPCRFGGEVKDFSAKDHVPKSYRKAVKVMARDIELAVAAAKAAAEDARLVTRGFLEATPDAPTTYPGSRLGCHIGAGLIAAETLELTSALATARDPNQPEELRRRTNGFDVRRWGTIQEAAPHGVTVGGMNNLQPLWLLKYLPNMLACHVTIIHGAEGPSNTITCGEASGLLSIGESARVIERGDADACFAGGCESKLSHMGLLRLSLLGRLAPTGTTQAADAWRLVRPFDPQSLGTIPGEGGGILILESHDSARARGATILAEVAGFGAAHTPHATNLPTPSRTWEDHPPNKGLAAAIKAAMRDAGVGPGDIDAIVPEGHGSPAVDAGEVGAIRAVLGQRASGIPVITITPFVGACSAGHGSLLAAVGARALATGLMPARLHAGTPALRAEGGPSRSATLNTVLVCTGSLGGQNAAMILRRAH